MTTPENAERTHMDRYPDETLSPDDDDGTMIESKEALAQAVVGHRIVKVEQGDSNTIITLDDGQQVRLKGVGDCCAYTELESFLLHAERVDHIITGVGTTEGYTKWHIYADMGDVLELTVGWSCGNPFYYAYGFDITVEPVEEEQHAPDENAASEEQPCPECKHPLDDRSGYPDLGHAGLHAGSAALRLVPDVAAPDG